MADREILWRVNERDWFDPSGESDGFSSVSFECDRFVNEDDLPERLPWLNGSVGVNDGGESVYLRFDFWGGVDPTRDEYLRLSRNKIAVLRRMLNVAEEALDRFEAETKGE